MQRRKFIKAGLQFSLMTACLDLFSLNRILGTSHDELIGKGNPDLVGTEIKFRKEVYDAYIKMQAEAKKVGILITAVSAYRSFSRQKQIWTRKYNQYLAQGLSPQKSIEKIIQYSTIPGTSRHHWGTDIDIVDGNHMDVPHLLAPSNFDEGKPFYKLGQWLEKHASDYGFYQVYTNDPERKGFNYEPWHYSYKPLSKLYLEKYLELDILSLLKNEKFPGSEHFTEQLMTSYISEHILDINPELLP